MALLLLALLVGTQMPGIWRAAVNQAIAPNWGLSSWAHFVIFAAMAGLAYAQPIAWALPRLLPGALGLALLTEGLQFFAQDRHPRWLDVGIDMAGAAFGVLCVTMVRWRLARARA